MQLDRAIYSYPFHNHVLNYKKYVLQIWFERVKLATVSGSVITGERVPSTGEPGKKVLLKHKRICR